MFSLQDGFTALYIAQYLSKTVTTIEWKLILEMLLRVTTTQVSVTVLERVEVRGIVALFLLWVAGNTVVKWFV
jgi:hypothetical protein